MTSLNIASKDRNRGEPDAEAIGVFPTVIRGFLKEYRPSRMPFFRHLANLPFPVASDPRLLGQIHLIYQSAMHATRAAVYYLPHLNSPALRKRKLRILIDDDGLPGGDTHHYQLTRAFLNIGAQSLLADEEFGHGAFTPFLAKPGKTSRAWPSRLVHRFVETNPMGGIHFSRHGL